MQPYPNTILIVDDEPVGRTTLEGLLTNQGYNLIFADNGEDALKKATDFTPDLILTDVMMPDMDGFEVCQRLRADPTLAEVPIIMVTALDDRDSRLQGIEAGADDFITKPFDRVELRTRIRTVTRLNRFRRLITERNKFDWVIDHAEDGYLIIKAGEIRYANQKARLYLNLPTDPHQTINKTFQELIKEHYRSEPQAAWAKKAWLEQSDFLQPCPQYLVRPETPTSNAFWLQINSLQINSQDNSSGEWVIRLRDVTREMDIQRSRWQFQAMVSHKLRTPMISMLSGMELLAAHAKEFSIAEITQLAERAVQSTQRLRSEIDDILQHTRISVIPRPGLNEELRLAQLQSLTVEICQDLNLNHVTFCIEPDMEESNVVTISQSAIRLVLREILENAQKFHPTGTPQVIIHTSKSSDNQAISIKVTDDGLTLSPEQLAQVWTPYYQGEKYFTGEVAGMGLGLSMVASTILSLGGSYQMYNREPGPGVTVELVLPLETTNRKE
ncbi:MAG: response regulator [Anaerolineales bacterium]|nr:response regulator [Anaerolineales bacterium]